MIIFEDTQISHLNMAYVVWSDNALHAFRPDQCFAVFDEMQARGVVANTITYNTPLDACAKGGKGVCTQVSRCAKFQVFHVLFFSWWIF